MYVKKSTPVLKGDSFEPPYRIKRYDAQEDPDEVTLENACMHEKHGGHSKTAAYEIEDKDCFPLGRAQVHKSMRNMVFPGCG